MLLKAGWAKAEITPPLGHPLAGYVRRTSPGQGTSDPLLVRALVLGTGRSRVALVTADILLFSNRWAERLRQKIAPVLNVDSSRVVLAATHTHSGPVIDMAPFDFSPAGSKPQFASYASRVERQILRSAEKAARSLSPVNASFAKIRVRGVASDRDRPQRFRSQPMFLLRFESSSCAAVYGIYGCHSTVLGYSNALFSGDLLGGLARQLGSGEEFVLFGCGAAANISTRFTRRAQTPEELSRLTLLAASQARKALYRPLDIASVRVRVKNVFLRFRNLDIAPPTGVKGKGRLAEARAEALENLCRLRQAREFRSSGASIALTQIELGELSLLALPFEIGLSTGEFLWRRSNTIPLCYANGYWGYLPPSGANAGDYEVISSAFPREADQQLKKAALTFLRSP